ncbi:1180_t:CDS:1, partial [Funneliformis geosporum]
CLNQNISGVIVSFSTFYHYRKNQQEFLDMKETNIIYDEQTIYRKNQKEFLDIEETNIIYDEQTMEDI